MTEGSIKTLFVGLGNSRVAWYRCFLPALYIGADWAGIVGQPPKMQVATSFIQGRTEAPDLGAYDLLIIQQPRGRGWFRLITELRKAGAVVLGEYDDYVHGIRRSKDHDFSMFFQKDHLKSMELCMRACDGLICSTDYIADKYRRFNPHTWVAPNGLDMGRYRLSRPPRGELNGVETVTIMWAGATGHWRAAGPWINVVDRVMERYPHVCFASIGQAFGTILQEKYGERVISVPFASLETYPAAMMLGDIALAPAGTSSWYRGKSGLRAMEAAALGIPVIAASHYDNEVDHGNTGFVCDTPTEIEARLVDLIEDPALRATMGDRARVHAGQFDMKTRRQGWQTALTNAYEVCSV